MKKKYHNVGTVPNLIEKIVGRVKIYTHNTQIHFNKSGAGAGIKPPFVVK